jgi:sugar-specific transcriptional regulator TrmB
MVRGFVSLGLRQLEAEVYIHIALNGPKKARDIAEALKISEQLLYRSLRSLKSKEIVHTSPPRPAEFSAIPFDKALELLMKAHIRESQNIEQEKDEILSQWRYMVTKQHRLKRIVY